jgi:hypothetical protein
MSKSGAEEREYCTRCAWAGVTVVPVTKLRVTKVTAGCTSTLSGVACYSSFTMTTPIVLHTLAPYHPILCPHHHMQPPCSHGRCNGLVPSVSIISRALFGLGGKSSCGGPRMCCRQRTGGSDNESEPHLIGTRRTGPLFPAHCPTQRQNLGPYQLCHHCRPPLHPEANSFHPVWDSIVRYMPRNNFWKYPTLKLA